MRAVLACPHVLGGAAVTAACAHADADLVEVALDDFEEADGDGWGPPVVWRRSPRDLELRRLQEEHFLAAYAQQQRAERVTLAYAEEHERYFGLGEHRGSGVEQLLEPHGTAGGYRRCREGEGFGRCPLCRAWQADRVARNRQARAGRCTRTRSSYDAGCRCRSCSTANAAGCRRWRAAA